MYRKITEIIHRFGIIRKVWSARNNPLGQGYGRLPVFLRTDGGGGVVVVVVVPSLAVQLLRGWYGRSDSVKSFGLTLPCLFPPFDAIGCASGGKIHTRYLVSYDR